MSRCGMPLYEFRCSKCGVKKDLIRPRALRYAPVMCADVLSPEERPEGCEGDGEMTRTGEVETGHPTRYAWQA